MDRSLTAAAPIQPCYGDGNEIAATGHWLISSVCICVHPWLISLRLLSKRKVRLYILLWQ